MASVLPEPMIASDLPVDMNTKENRYISSAVYITPQCKSQKVTVNGGTSQSLRSTPADHPQSTAKKKKNNKKKAKKAHTSSKKLKAGSGTCYKSREFIDSSDSSSDDEDKSCKEPNHNITCSNCNTPGNKAKVRCVDCKEYLCDKCCAFHEGIKALKDHKIINIEDILAGKVDPKIEEENRFCKTHDKVCEYYCETEKRVLCRDCVILNECPAQHSRVSLEKAAQKQSDELKALMNQCGDSLKKFEVAMDATMNVKAELKFNSQVAKASVVRVEKEYIDLVKRKVKSLSENIDKITNEGMEELDQKQKYLESIIGEFHRSAEDLSRVVESDFEVIATHATLSSQLAKLSKSEPGSVNKSLSCVSFQANTLVVPTIGKVLKDGPKEAEWKQVGLFSTGDLNELLGLDLNQAGNVVLCSWGKGVKVFSREGEVVCTLDESCGAADVVVTPDQKYITIPKGQRQLVTFDKTGEQVNTTPISNLNNLPSHVNSVAIDPKGRIIVAQAKNTISIHNPDGSVISKFATQSMPLRLAVTSNGEIVSSFYDRALKRGTSVQLMDYSGGNIRVIQPPPDEVKVWAPSFVCCGQDEIFISYGSGGRGDPSGVCRFTSEGDYLGCVTIEVREPQGIALSRNGKELFVADFYGRQVKILQCQNLK